MTNLRLIVLVIFTLFYSCKGEEKKVVSETAHNSVYYTCSMHTQIRENHPGKCPICGMKLIKVEIQKSDLNQITLSKQQIYLGNIASAIISESSHTLTDKFTGRIVTNQNNDFLITSRAMGRIEHIYYKTTGEVMGINMPLYDLYSEEIAIVKNDYLAAYSGLHSEKNTSINFNVLMQSAKQKLELFGLNKKQIQDIITKKDISPITTFYSNKTGTIKSVLKSEGDFVMEGESIYGVIDLKSIWFEAEINSIYFDKVKLDLPVQVSFFEYPNVNFMGKISFSNPELSINSKNFLVRVEIGNPDLNLFPGMQGEMELSTKKTTGIYIPSEAIIREQNSNTVWIEVQNGVFESVMVETGNELENDLVEIISGLKVGQRVVTSGAYSINNEYKFKKGADPMDGMKM